jgi:hypothetical protein
MTTPIDEARIYQRYMEDAASYGWNLSASEFRNVSLAFARLASALSVQQSGEGMPSRDTERLDWLEANKGPAKGGWEVVAPDKGWGLNVRTRGPFNSLRRAIDAAMSSHSSTSRATRET